MNCFISNKDMKTKSLTITLIIIFASISLFSQQNYLSFKKEYPAKEKVVLEGKKIKIFTFNDRSYKGKIYFLDNDKILIGTDTISLSEINSIRVRTLTHIISGAALSATGAGMVVGGVSLLANLFAAEESSMILLSILGAPLAMSGFSVITYGAVIIFWARNYHSAKWEYEIVTFEQQE